MPNAAATPHAPVREDASRGRAFLARGALELARPAQEALDPDYDPWAGYEWPDRAGQLERAPRKKRTTT